MRPMIALFILATLLGNCRSDEKFNISRHDRRDPFTFCSEYPIIIEPPPPPPPIDITKDLKEASSALHRAEIALTDLNSRVALSECGRAHNGIETALAAVESPEARQLLQDLDRLRKAASHLQQRQSTESDFQKMRVSVTGIVANAKQSRAIVNGTLVRPNESVPNSENEILVVEQILPEKVILNFRGYRLAATIETADAK